VTAVEELERPAGTVPGIPECQAMIPVFLEPVYPPSLMRCPEDAVGLFAGRCPCGHAREAWLCAGCSQMLRQSGCRECLEDEDMPHECPLAVRRVTEAGRG
jgi:hypothetical protein